MTQSNQDRIDDLENKLAAMSYRIEDMRKEFEAKINEIVGKKEDAIDQYASYAKKMKIAEHMKSMASTEKYKEYLPKLL